MASYRYDPFGRRYSKSVNGVTTVYDDDPEGRVIADYDGSGHVLRLYGYLGAATAPVVVMTPTGAMNGNNPVMSLVYNHVDRQGSVVATSANGALVGSFSYTPFGESPGNPELTGTEFGFDGYQYDAETGLYHKQNRYYDPRLGRFLSPDPLGQAAGKNVYAYVRDDPLDNVDPLGLWQATISGGLGFGGALTFGYNSGQWNVGAYVGPAIGANLSVNPANAATTRPGVYTSFVGSAGAEVGPIAVDVGGSAQTTVPQDRVMNYGTASAEASVNFGAYSAGGEATIHPNGSVTVTPKVTVGLGTSAYGPWGVAYQSTPSQPSPSVSALQPNSSSAPATTGLGATK